MQPKDFLHFLTDKDGNSYYQDNGVIATSTTQIPLDNAPDGWQDTSISWKRDSKYYGIFRSFTTPLKFVRGAAKIIRTRLYTYGYEDKINMVILWLDKTFSGGWIYRSFYRGELDLSQSSDELTHIELPIMEGELAKLLKANENTIYEIDINGPVVQDDGVYLYQTINWLNIVQSHPASGTIGGTRYIINTIFLSTEGSAFGIDVSSSNAFDGIDNDTSSSSLFWSFRAKQDIADLRLIWDVVVHATNNIIANGFKLFIKTSAGRELEIYSNPVPVAQDEKISIHIDFPFNAVAGELFFITQVYAENNLFYIIYEESTMQVKYKSRYRTTYTPTIRPVAVGQAILDKMAGPGYIFQSDYLSNTWDNLVITSGDAIRGISGAKIHISMAILITGYNTPANLSTTIVGKTIIVERKSNAYQPTVVADLGEVSELKIIQDKEAQFAGVRCGYPDIDTHSFDSINAKSEFNVTSNYTGPVTRNSAVLDLVSPIKASMYEQEIIRINLEGKTTISDGTDNDVFFKHIERLANVDTAISGSWYSITYNGGTSTHYFLNTYTGFYDTRLIPQPPPFPATVNLSDMVFVALGVTAMIAYINGSGMYPGWDGNLNVTPNVSALPAGVTYYKYLRLPYDSVDGILDPETAYNVEISPGRCMRNHGDELAAYYYWWSGNQLVFNSSATTAALKTVKAGVTIEERADIVIADFGAPLFIPMDFDCKSPMNRDIVNVMRDTPAGTFRIEDPDFGELFGFVKQLSIQPANKPAQETQLICSPATNILKLIH
jgi:hypothetical protein